MTWHETGTVSPRSLNDARLQVHYGALLLGSAAHSLLKHEADDSHANLGFDPSTRSLFTRPLDPAGAVELRLDIPGFALVLRRGQGSSERLPLGGQSLRSALDWIRSRLGTTTELVKREFPDFPASPIGEGGTFTAPADDELEEIARWFANGLERIEGLRASHSALSEVRVWTHHFDLGALLPLDGGGERMLGLGLSPGDHNYDQPYFYCSPYPQPTVEERPDLPVGHWHTEGFLSAVATAEELQASPSQGPAAGQYLTGAIAACQALLT